MVRNRSSSARHSWVAVVGSARQPWRTASASSGIVSSHEQIRRCLGGSAIALTISCRPDFVFQSQRNWPELAGKYILSVLKSTIPEIVGEAAADHPARSIGFVHF